MIRFDPQSPYAVIGLGGGPCWSGYYELIQAAAWRLAADGGMRLYRQLGLRPDVVVGDLDSLLPDEIGYLKQSRLEVERHPAAKDRTDGHLAIDLAIRKEFRQILLLGGIGNRMDHTLTNLHLLKYGRDQGVLIRLRDPHNDIVLIGDGQCYQLEQTEEAHVSLIPLSERVLGVCLKGFRWELEQAELRRTDSLGVSNYLTAAHGTVSVTQGLLYVMRTTD